MNRALRRSFLAFVGAVVVIGGWLGAPLFGAPAGPLADTRPERSVVVSGAATAGPTTAGPTAAPVAGRSQSPPPAPSVTPSFGPSGSGSSTPAPSPSPIRGRGTASATPSLRAALQARLERLRVSAGIPGVSASILFDDGSLWEGAAGLADVAASRPVTPDTAFPVASISKTFTAALILRLVEDGRLGLDMPVTSYLPKLAIDRAITVRQLLDHTSGLRDFYFDPRIDKALLTSPTRVWDAARSLSYVGKPFAPPGTSWHYSNTNYLILGLLAEARGGGSVAEQLRDRFFSPLGLGHTFYQSSEAPRGPLVRSYRFRGADPTLPPIDLSDGTRVVPFTSVVTAAGAAGSIATTSGDLARWARAVYSGPALDPASRAAMVLDVLRTAPYKPAIAYGLGLQVVWVDGHLTLGHSGRFLGARAIVRWLPDERVAIAVLTNQSRSDPNIIVGDLLTLALQPESDCRACPAIP